MIIGIAATITIFGAFTELNVLDSAEAFRLTSLLNESAYKRARQKYSEEYYSDARDIFKLLSGYVESDKYELLCDLADESISDANYRVVLQNIDFANTKTLLLSKHRLAILFLSGTWRTSNGRYYFTMDKSTHQTSYNLPGLALANSHYIVEDGIYFLERGNALLEKYGLESAMDYEKKKVFKFSILTAETISVYCYKDGSTYTLYRQ